nr:tetratricopeptide repeat protein [Pyxidicoccus fallax]
MALLEVVVSDTPPAGENKKPAVPEPVAEAVIRGEISLARFVGASNEDLYRWANIAHQLLQAGSTQQALTIFQGLVVASPMDAVFHAQLAATYMTLERFDEAFDEFNEALKYNRSHVDALAGRGEVYLRRGQVPEALADLSAAIQKDPTLKRAATQRAHGTLLALKQQAEQANKAK